MTTTLPKERQRRSHLRDYLLTLAEIHGLVTVFVFSHGFRTYCLYRQFCYDCNRILFYLNVRRLASTHVLVPCAHAPANQGGIPSQEATIARLGRESKSHPQDLDNLISLLDVYDTLNPRPDELGLKSGKIGMHWIPWRP